MSDEPVTRADPEDIGPLLARGALAMIGALLLFVCGIIVAQVCLLPSRTPTTEVWAALTGIIGFVTGVVGTIYAYRFGSTKQSAAKDLVISTQLAKGR